jgi:hypothetical protein
MFEGVLKGVIFGAIVAIVLIIGISNIANAMNKSTTKHLPSIVGYCDRPILTAPEGTYCIIYANVNELQIQHSKDRKTIHPFIPYSRVHKIEFCTEDGSPSPVIFRHYDEIPERFVIEYDDENGKREQIYFSQTIQTQGINQMSLNLSVNFFEYVASQKVKFEGASCITNESEN